MGDTRGLGILSSAVDVLEMSVVRGVDGVSGMCMCLARGGVLGVRGLCLGFINPERTGGSGIYVCLLVAAVCVVLTWSVWEAWARVWEGEVVLSLCLL